MAEFRPVNLAEIYGQIDAAKANQAQMQNNAMMQERQRKQFAMEDEAINKQRRISDIYRNSMTNVDGQVQFDDNRYISELANIDPFEAKKELDARSKREQDALDSKSKRNKEDLENRKATAAYLRDRLAGVQDQSSYDAVMGEAAELGAGFIKGAPREFNPEFVRSQLFTADEFLKQSTPKYEKVDLGGKVQVIDVNPMTNPSIKGTSLDKTQTPDSIASTQQQELNRGVTIRGQNMTDARAKEKNQIDASAGGYSTKPLPATALKMQNDALDKLSISSNNTQKLLDVKNQIESGKLNLGLISNISGNVRNTLGRSTESSRNLSSFKSTLEKLRNDSLRLNSGVQTDGDAQRAWNELFENINDQELVKQRLGEIAEINKRGAELQKLQIENIRGNYNAPPVDFSKYESTPTQARTQARTQVKQPPVKPSGNLSITAPNGKVYSFKSQAQLNEFKRQSGL
jgi:hypothetical protein